LAAALAISVSGGVAAFPDAATRDHHDQKINIEGIAHDRQ
jgi:hypothetical protein